MDILVTGGAGFIGSHLVGMLLREIRGCRVLTLDALTYAGNLRNLEGVEARWGGGAPAAKRRHLFIRGDVRDAALAEKIFHGKIRVSGWKARPVSAVFHLAAESHVDRSLHDAAPFLRTNVLGTQTLLEAARRAPALRRFVHVSTDEVYGSLGPRGKFTEESPLRPRSPYAASKAAADMLVQSYAHSFGLPALITRSSNNYGPRQLPEKFIPLMVCRLLEGRPVPVYGRGANMRDWIHVEDNCRGLVAAWRKGRPGGVYHFGGGTVIRNLDLAQKVLRLMKKPRMMLAFVADRPGHDFRYALDCRRTSRKLGWRPRVPFAKGLAETVRWYAENRAWVEGVTSGAYRKYFMRTYGGRGMAS